MEPRSHEEHIRHTFDAFCKKALRNEARDYLDELARRRSREISFSELPVEVMEQLSVCDDYFAEDRTFDVLGYIVQIASDELAEAITSLPAEKRNIIANEPKVSFRDGHYYVFDGQHTIVARKHMNGNNDLPILCKVYYGMTEADEALLFAMQTGYSAALTPSARLRANLRGEDKASGEFYEATEDVGFHVGFERGGGVGRIICINTAFAEFKRVGAEIYKEALTLLLEAWGGDPDSLRAEIIQGIVHFVELYHGEYDRERLIYSLRSYEPKFIYAAGKAEKELRGVKRYVNLFYRIYNGRRRHSTLPMKF